MPVGAVDTNLALQLEALAHQEGIDRWQLVVSLNDPNPRSRAELDGLLAPFELPDVVVVDSSDVRSAAHARNVAAAHASSDRLAFCDGDDIVDRDWLAAIDRGLESYQAVGGFLDEELLGVPGQAHWRPPATPGALPTFLDHPYLVTANMGVHRSAFETAGGFDTTLLRGEDIAFSWQLIDDGVEMAFWPEAVVYYRHRAGLAAMMRQHYLYGRGLSQLLARRGLPGGQGPAGGLGSLRPNGQPVDQYGVAYVLRRGSIASGRLVGLLTERGQVRPLELSSFPSPED